MHSYTPYHYTSLIFHPIVHSHLSAIVYSVVNKTSTQQGKRRTMCTTRIFLCSFVLGAIVVESFLPNWINTSGRLITPKKNVLESTASSKEADIADTYEYIKDGAFDNTAKAQIPLKIAVAGGGVGGMFTAYALQQKGFDVTLFEKASKFSRFGGPIQLASNALSCINALSPDLFDEIMTRFTFTGTRKCGIKVSERSCDSSFFQPHPTLHYSIYPTRIHDKPTILPTFVHNFPSHLPNQDGIRNSWYSIFDAITNLAEWNDLPYTGMTADNFLCNYFAPYLTY